MRAFVMELLRGMLNAKALDVGEGMGWQDRCCACHCNASHE